MKKVYKVLLYILAAHVLLAVSFFVYININTGILADASHLHESIHSFTPQSVKVEGVPLYTQPDGYSCGAATISVLVSFCTNRDLPPQLFIDKYTLSGGMLYETFIDILSKELPEYRIVYQHDQSDIELIQAIHEQLQRGLPVPIFFGAANPFKISPDAENRAEAWIHRHEFHYPVAKEVIAAANSTV